MYLRSSSGDVYVPFPDYLGDGYHGQSEAIAFSESGHTDRMSEVNDLSINGR
jgi:hypothetical protein